MLFNDALNTFYLRLYGVGHIVKDHSDSKRGNLLQPHGLLFYMHRQDSTYHSLCYTSRGALAGTICYGRLESCYYVIVVLYLQW